MAMTSLHRVRFDWGANMALEIEWAKGEEGGVVDVAVPNASQATLELTADKPAELGIPAIGWIPENTGLFEPLQLREETTYLVDSFLPVSRQSAEKHWRERRSWPLPESLDRVYVSDPPKRWRSTETGGIVIPGRLNFGAHVGVADIGLPNLPGVVLEVVATKVGYVADFKALLDLIADELVNLLLQIEEPTRLYLGLKETTASDPQTLLFHVRRLMAPTRLPLALESVARRPHHQTRSREEQRPLGLISNPDPLLVIQRLPSLEFRRGGPAASLFGGFTPAQLPDERTVDTFDTPENRYVKAFLEDLQVKLTTLRASLIAANKERTVREVDGWESEIADWLSEPIWKEVRPLRYFPSNSQVLQKREGYKEVLSADIALQFSLQLPWERGLQLAEGLDGDVRPISELYQYWCYFVLRGVLRTICGPEDKNRGTLIEFKDKGVTVNLKKGQESTAIFSYVPALGSPARISLFYNKRFTPKKRSPSYWSGTYSAQFDPDYSILVEVDTPDGKRLHWLHFDAKYRLDFAQWNGVIGTSEPLVEAEILEERAASSGGRPAYMKDDLYKMHTYRDAVLGSRGSYVVFPGDGEDEEIFTRYPPNLETEDSRIPSVGAFQLRPYHQARQIETLEHFLRKVFSQMSQALTTYVEETGFL